LADHAKLAKLDMKRPYDGHKARGFALERLFIGFGLVMFVAGLAAIGLGLPYIVLERGFTQVIAGTSISTSGLVLAALGYVLRDVRSLRVLVAGFRAVTAVDVFAGAEMTDHAQTTSNSTTTSVPMQSLAVHGKSSALSGLAAAGAGAAALAGGLALAGSRASVIDGHGETETTSGQQAHDMLAAGPVSDLAVNEAADNEVADENSANVSDLHDSPLIAPADSAVDDLNAQIDLAVGDLSSLRRDLTPENSDDADDEDSGADDKTDNEDVSVITKTGGGVDGTIARSSTEDELADDEPTNQELLIADDAFEAEVSETDAADMDAPDLSKQPTNVTNKNDDQADESLQPVASDEGIVGVHTVGTSTFTMYSDGTIRAETPKGPLQFPDVTALKFYLAAEKI
jgi:hypothetical protein